MKLGIVISNFYGKYAEIMEKKANEAAEELEAQFIEKVYVPGSFEIPLAVQKLLKNKEVDGVVALGVVIQGGTDHDVIVAENAARKLADLILEYDKPIGLGLIGPRANKKQAEERLEEYAERAVRTTVEMIRKLG